MLVSDRDINTDALLCASAACATCSTTVTAVISNICYILLASTYNTTYIYSDVNCVLVVQMITNVRHYVRHMQNM